jgi:hypothetical protein
MKLKLALLCALAGASVQAMACYTVYDRNDRVVYNAQTAPVDMSQPIHVTLPRAFPGGHMVTDLGNDCPVHAAAAVRTRSLQPAASSAPLLTDEATARELHLPHAQLASGAAIVPAQAVARLDLPTFSVIQTANDNVVAVAAARNPTQAMGAGPAPSATRSMGAAQAPLQQHGAVITELRDPPVTIIRRGHDITVRQR